MTPTRPPTPAEIEARYQSAYAEWHQGIGKGGIETVASILCRNVAERDREIAGLLLRLSSKDALIEKAARVYDERGETIAGLRARVATAEAESATAERLLYIQDRAIIAALDAAGVPAHDRLASRTRALVAERDELRRERDEARAALAGVLADVEARRDKDRGVAKDHPNVATIALCVADALHQLATDLRAGPSGQALTALLDEARREEREACAVIADGWRLTDSANATDYDCIAHDTADNIGRAIRAALKPTP